MSIFSELFNVYQPPSDFSAIINPMPSKTTNRAFRGALAIFLLAGIYGFIGYFARELAPGLSLWQQTYARLLLGAPFMYLTFRKKIDLKKCLEFVKRERFLIGLRSLCLYILSVPVYFYAVQNASLGNVALLQVLPYIFI